MTLPDYVCFGVSDGRPAIPSATRTPADARQYHAASTQLPSVPPAKQEATPPNSVNGGKWKGVLSGRKSSRGRVARSPR